ncbi:MAG: macro domain-containing protein [Woeseiaceae bacterium]
MENKTHMQFLFGDRELIILMADLLAAPVEVIVNAANGGLSHGGGVAGLISDQGGESIQQESDQFIKEHGMLESGMVALTTAGRLPFDAIVHAVGPKMGEGDEQEKIQQAVARSLQLCDMHDWESIAFPAISTGIFGVSIETAARAFFLAITSYWDARMDIAPEKVMICLTEKKFLPFIHAFREISLEKDTQDEGQTLAKPKSYNPEDETELEAGIVDLSEDDLSGQNNDEINDWFH